MRFTVEDDQSGEGPYLVCPACGLPPRQEDTYRRSSGMFECRLVCDSCSNEVKLRCSWNRQNQGWDVEQQEQEK